LFTVYHTLELHDLDILRFPASGSGKRSLPNGSTAAVSPEEKLRRAMEQEADGDHCLVALLVRNAYGVPFEVSLTRQSEGDGEGDEVEEDLRSTHLIPPGASER
jgi:hypothetical protein